MDKPAPVEHPVHELIRRRWSPYSFDPARPVDGAALRSLFEAARWAPSSFNEQPWAFIFAHRTDAEFARLLDCLVPVNQKWAANAAVLMITASRLTFERNGKPNRHAMYDTGAAMAFLTVQAESMGLQVHQMAGIDLDKCRANLGIPAGWDPASGVAIGWAGTVGQLPEDLRQRQNAPRSRKSMTNFVFHARWGEPLAG
jgi:nitroreductase